ncbi:MAG TPA: hypothetical protein DCK95_02890 [Anaerolineaceae bacterium]|uniref:YprB ribonuclease H-like domain-containing protein n=1 Tax=Anaerolinea thermophila TaxID=167964 RepID=A0A101FYT4_9CHLR|nr:MAG: hypothetical protein XD73_0242 [Anaerolinea thermophila]HAF61254.1 hypothetical protein [Anaerolineaceae bacterium]
MNSLLEQLKSLGVELGKDKTSFKKKDAIDLSLVLGGVWENTPYGRTLHIHQDYESNTVYGKTALYYKSTDASLLDFFNLHLSQEQKDTFSNRTICFFDTETSSLNLGSGAFVFLCGFSYFNEDGGVCTDQFFMPHPSDERAFIYAVQSFLLPFTVLSSYNGKSFDIPMLRNRYILTAMEDESLDKPHLDLLFVARSLWKRRLDSCRLADIERNILGFERDEEEVPGYLVPLLYQDYLREGDATPLKGVLSHNAQDVVSLAALYIVLGNILVNENHLIDHPDDLVSLAYYYQKIGRMDSAVQYFDAYLDKSEENVDPAVLYDYAWLHRRNENWSEAIKLWLRAAKMDHIPSIIEVAKYYEHQQKDPAQAMQWLERIDNGEKQRAAIIKDDLPRRSARLMSKMEKNDENRKF